MSLSKAIAQAKEFGLNEEQVVYKVAAAYLSDCFGITTTVDAIDCLKSFPTIVRNEDSCGIFYPVEGKLTFHPLTFTAGALSLTDKATKEGVTYFQVTYNPDTSVIKDADAEGYIVPAIFANLSKRAMTSLVAPGVALEKMSSAFLPGNPVDLQDGDYPVTEVLTQGANAYRIVTAKFSVRISEKVMQETKINTDSSITLKDNVPFMGETRLTGGDVEILEIPAEKGFSINVTGIVFTKPGVAYLTTNDNKCYWAPLSIKDLSKNLAPMPLPAIKLQVVDTRTKDNKTYPVVDYSKI